MTNFINRMSEPGHDELFKTSWTPAPEQPEIEAGSLWGRVTCIPAHEMPGRVQDDKLPPGFWIPLIDEICLRLECTRRLDALRIPLASPELARKARNALINEIARRFGNTAIETRLIDHVIFVRRGKGWPRPMIDKRNGD